MPLLSQKMKFSKQSRMACTACIPALAEKTIQRWQHSKDCVAITATIRLLAYQPDRAMDNQRAKMQRQLQAAATGLQAACRGQAPECKRRSITEGTDAGEAVLPQNY